MRELDKTAPEIVSFFFAEDKICTLDIVQFVCEDFAWFILKILTDHACQTISILKSKFIFLNYRCRVNQDICHHVKNCT